jgi:hypothetical protein
VRSTAPIANQRDHPLGGLENGDAGHPALRLLDREHALEADQGHRRDEDGEQGDGAADADGDADRDRHHQDRRRRQGGDIERRPEGGADRAAAGVQDRDRQEGPRPGQLRDAERHREEQRERTEATRPKRAGEDDDQPEVGDRPSQIAAPEPGDVSA